MSDRWGEPITGKKTVKKGETLTEISKILDLPVDSLVSFNNLSNPNDIKVGQELLYRKEPGFWDNTFRWAFESSNEARDSREINNQINRNIKKGKINPNQFFNIGNYNNLSDYLKREYNIDLYTSDIKNLNTLYKFFRDKNWNRNQTLAIMSSIIAESGGDPLKKELNNGPGRGLLQFTDLARKEMMNNYRFNGDNNNELLRQANFINDEMRGNVKFSNGQVTQWLGDNRASEERFIRGDIPLSELNEIYVKRYVRPKDTIGAINKRYKLALILDKIISKEYNPELIAKNKNGGIIKGEEGLNISTIKIDPSIFTSWNAIKLPEIKIKNEEDGSGLSDYLLKDFNSFFYTPPVKIKSKEEENNVNDEGEIDRVKNTQSEQQFTSENKVKSSNTYYYNNKEKWISDLTEAYKKAGITNPEALKYLLAQDALESGWGKSAQGNYNFGNLTTGSSWKGNYVQGKDKDANGNPISQKFRSYNNMDEYALDKVNFLTRLYDFNQNDNFQTFVSKLTGNNKGKRRYAEARNYGESLTKVFQSLINKHQEGGILLSNPETSEMLTYIKDGKFITVPNPGAGFISGTDPIGQVVVEGAILNKPLGWAFGKAINWAKGLLGKRNISAGNFSKGEEVINSSKETIKREDLPSYANPNWQGDSVELTKDRLRNGGFERLEQSTNNILDNPFEYNLKDSGDGIKFISPKYFPEIRNKILKSNPKNFTSKEVNKKSTNVGYGEPNGSLNNSDNWGIFNDAPSKYLNNPQIKSDVNAHEFSHWIYYPKYGPSEKYFNYENLPSSLRSKGEFAGRGTQLKNYLGLKENEPLTGDMLKYAKENFAKDRGYDNHMIDFLNRIKDFDQVAKWLNTFSASIVPITIMSNDNN